MLACIPSQLQLETFQLSIHVFSLCVIIIILQAAVKYEEEAVKTSAVCNLNYCVLSR